MKPISLKSVKRFALASAIIVVILVMIFSSISFLNSRNSNKVKMASIGVQLREPSAPIFVAYDQNFFSRNGLKVTMKYYDVMGLKIIDAM